MYYFASDVHLGAGDKQTARSTERKFVQWIDFVSKDAKAIFLLGDIFDYWFEYEGVVPKGFVRVLGRLAALTDSGVRVVFITGNHDMWVRDYFQTECGMEVYTSPQTFEVAGRRLFLAHGDNMNVGNNFGLRLMNNIFRSKSVKWLFQWLVHPDLSMRLGHGWSASSRRKNPSNRKDISSHQSLLDYASTYAAESAQPIDYFVFGHLHSGAHYVELRPNVVILSEWEHTPLYGVMNDEGEFSLREFETIHI